MIIDVNTSFGFLAHQNLDLSLPVLLRTLEDHGITSGCTLSMRGIYYDYEEGNRETLDAAKTHPSLIPVATIDPRRYLGWEEEVDRCLREGFKVLRFFPEIQGWRVSSLPFRRILEKLSGRGVPVMVSATGWGTASEVGEVAADYDLSVILTDGHYTQMAEVIAAMQRYPQLYAETNRLATPGAVEVMVQETGAERILFGSGAPHQAPQSSLNMLLASGLTQREKAMVLRENAHRLLSMARTEVTLDHEGIPQARIPSEPVIDVHGHLGTWFFPTPTEGTSSILRLMAKYHIERCVLSSAPGIIYDFVEGNRQLKEAIFGHPSLRGYVVVNPNYFEQSCAELDRYYRDENFVGAKIHCAYSRSNTASRKTWALIEEVAKRGKPLLIHTGGSDALKTLREIARGYRDFTIIVAHGGGQGAGAIIADTDNIYLEFCSSSPNPWVIHEALEAIGPERLLFGSDQDLIDPGFVLGTYQDAGLTGETWRMVAYENAKRVFGI